LRARGGQILARGERRSPEIWQDPRRTGVALVHALLQPAGRPGELSEGNVVVPPARRGSRYLDYDGRLGTPASVRLAESAYVRFQRMCRGRNTTAFPLLIRHNRTRRPSRPSPRDTCRHACRRRSRGRRLLQVGSGSVGCATIESPADGSGLRLESARGQGEFLAIEN